MFSGLAFDASTATTIYNIGGVVVKNCECSVDYVTDLTKLPDDDAGDEEEYIGSGSFGPGGVDTPYMDDES